MSKLFTINILLFGLLGFWSGQQGEILEEIEAVDDFGSTINGESVVIDVLANDKGEEVKITQIVTAASCGEASEWQVDGAIIYTADETTSCTFDSFQYEIKDKFEEVDTATVIIAISKPSTELGVEVERDCSETYETGEYTVGISIFRGFPPFQVSVNEIDTVLYDIGVLYFTFIDFIETYEINIIDSLNQQFYAKGGENPCVWWHCDEVFYFKKEITCLGNNQTRVELFNSNIEEAYCIDSEGVYRELEIVDTVSNLSYLFVSLNNEFVFDTLLNCLTAHDDFFENCVETPLTFNVLENDFGQEIKVSQIVKMPNCGNLIEWLPNGEMAYEFNENSGCQKDTIIYELENAIGEQTTAIVSLDNLPEKDLSVTWKSTCEGAWSQDVILDFQINGGNPPYSLLGILNETYNYPEPEFAISFPVNEIGFLEVVDGNGQMFSLEIDTKFACIGHPAECYEPLFIHQYLEIECLETGGIVHFLERMNPNIIDRAFWIDPENNYHELSGFDTLPNYSYYYFQFKRLGHIDGFINCQTTSIEEENKITSNPSLQLYPNPNQGQFSLQIQSPSPSLQFFPIQVYHIGGQLVWEGKMQSNHLETLEVENVESGLYVLRVVLEEEVLVERFWVE